jgi:hypothetical protein
MTMGLELGWLPAMNDGNSLSLQLRTYNSNGTQTANCYQFPKSGTITEVGYFIHAITGSPGRFLYQINELGTSGNAGGAQLNSVNDYVDAGTQLTAGQTNWFVLNTPVSVTKGQWVAVNFRASTASGLWGTGNTMTARYNYGIEGPSSNLHYGAPYSASGTPKITTGGFYAFKFSDGSIWGFPLKEKELMAPAGAGTCYGNCLTIPSSWGAVKISGMTFMMNNTGLAGTDLTFRLHTVSGTTATVQRTKTIDGDFRRINVDVSRNVIYFDSDLTVNGGDKIIASVETTSTTNLLYRWTFEDDNNRKAMTPIIEQEGCSVNVSSGAITFEDSLYFSSILVNGFNIPTVGGTGMPNKFGGQYGNG